jgi:hypothetical protein
MGSNAPPCDPPSSGSPPLEIVQPEHRYHVHAREREPRSDRAEYRPAALTAGGLDSILACRGRGAAGEAPRVGSAILLLAGGWSFGITLAGVLDLPPLSAALAGFACLVAGALAPAGRVRLAALALMAALLGAGWAAWQAAPLTVSGSLDRVAGDVVVRGRILDAPTPRGQRAETILLVDAVAAPDPPGEFQPIDPDTARVLLRAPALAATYDDRVEVRGHLASPRSRPGWPLTEILARRGIYWTLDAGSVRVLEVGGPSLRQIPWPP